MSWPLVRLDECARIVGGATPSTSVPGYWDGDINWATPKDLSDLPGVHLDETPRKITKAGLASCAAEILPPGSVLFSSRAPIGHVAINTSPMATNQGFKSLVPDKQRADAGYLYWWLRCHRAFMENLGNGATFKEVSKAVVSRVEIPLPPLDEQRRIAAILNQADALRRKRSEIARVLQSLRTALFLESFGNPLANTTAPRRQLKVIGKISTGATPKGGNDGQFGHEVPFITPGDLGSGMQPKRMLSEAGAQSVRTVRAGSALVCCIGATIGKMDIAASKSAFNQQINAVEWGDEVDDIYGIETLRFYKDSIAASGASTTMPILKKSSFEQIAIPVAPLSAQKVFAEQVRQLQKVAAAGKLQAERLDALFASLQHRAFNGEL